MTEPTDDLAALKATIKDALNRSDTGDQNYKPLVIEEGGEWYLRGDIDPCKLAQTVHAAAAAPLSDRIAELEATLSARTPKTVNEDMSDGGDTVERFTEMLVYAFRDADNRRKYPDPAEVEDHWSGLKLNGTFYPGRLARDLIAWIDRRHDPEPWTRPPYPRKPEIGGEDDE